MGESFDEGSLTLTLDYSSIKGSNANPTIGTDHLKETHKIKLNMYA